MPWTFSSWTVLPLHLSREFRWERQVVARMPKAESYLAGQRRSTQDLSIVYSDRLVHKAYSIIVSPQRYVSYGAQFLTPAQVNDHHDRDREAHMKC